MGGFRLTISPDALLYRPVSLKRGLCQILVLFSIKIIAGATSRGVFRFQMLKKRFFIYVSFDVDIRLRKEARTKNRFHKRSGIPMLNKNTTLVIFLTNGRILYFTENIFIHI